MANQNPIHIGDPEVYSEYIIPKKYANTTLYLSTNTSIGDKEKWKLDVFHILSFKGDPLDFDADPDIKRKEIDVCKNLGDCQLSLQTKASRIRNGGSGQPPKVTYTLLLEADDSNIDDLEFTIISDHTNPVTFYTKIIFKIEP